MHRQLYTSIILTGFLALLLPACAPPGGQVPGTPTATPVGQASPGPTATVPAVTPPNPGGSPTAVAVQAPIGVASPSAGAEVRSPVTVRGTASVFEATVQIAVKNAQGEIVGRGFTTATVGAPERGDYTATIPFTLSGGRQNGTVEVYSGSPRDGSPQHLVSVPVVLVPG